MKTTLSTLAALSLTVAATSAQGALVVYESFSQPAGDLSGKTAETGFNGNWTTNNTAVDIVNPSTLAYGDLPNTGGQVNLPNNAGIWASAPLGTDLFDAGLLNDGATLWFSYAYQKTTNGGSNEHSGFALATERVNPAFNGLNLASAGNGVGVYVGSTTSASAVASSWSNATARNGGTGTAALQALGTPTLVIGKIVWGAGTETITVYTRAMDDIDVEPTTGGSTRTVASFDQTQLDTISFAQRNSGGTQYYDEIRFGSTYADVIGVPEPGSLALLGLGTVMMLKRRRRD